MSRSSAGGGTRTIRVDNLARVEGEGALLLRVRRGKVEQAELRIFEPPRLFEALLRGRALDEVPDIVARICGICPVAYQMSAVHAIEKALEVEVDPSVRALRRLLYCGEWIESHVLHIHMLHAPDFLGYDGALEMASDHPEPVQRALRLKKTGNEIVRLLGGREIHPINVRPGGFYRAPSRRELLALREPLQRGIDEAEQSLRWVAGFDYPDFEREYTSVALRHTHEYPMNEGRVVASTGLDIEVAHYESFFAEEHLPHTTALHSVMLGHGPYLVGPLARLNLNAQLLAPRARAMLAELALPLPWLNPFHSILARGLEVLHAFETALALVDAYQPPPHPAARLEAREASGCWATEAPRGLLYHRYRIAADGTVQEARIVPPTSQNQATIEADLREFAERNLALPHAELQWRCEQSIRNYDPCISCATHFLELEIERD